MVCVLLDLPLFDAINRYHSEENHLQATKPIILATRFTCIVICTSAVIKRWRSETIIFDLSFATDFLLQIPPSFSLDSGIPLSVQMQIINLKWDNYFKRPKEPSRVVFIINEPADAIIISKDDTKNNVYKGEQHLK